jgi:hypothetical protein
MCKELGNITMRMMKEHLSQTKKQTTKLVFAFFNSVGIIPKEITRLV